MPDSPASAAALIVVDVQRAFDQWEAAGKRRNNPHAVARIVDLLNAFRERGAPIFHIRHQGTNPNSSFLLDGTGYPVKDEAREQAGEPVIKTRVNCGRTTNHGVETTTRMAGNLGFDARLVRDATWPFDRTGPDGDVHSAEEIHAMPLPNLNGGFARLGAASEAIAALQTRG